MLRRKFVAAVVLLTVMLTACSSGKEAAHQVHAPNGDMQEKTASANVLPSFLDGQSEEMRIVYQAAGKSAELLQWIPCYCGCGESAGHKSNLNCFINSINEDGSVVWDDHGTRCGVCLQIAGTSIRMYSEGTSMKDIRSYIDNTYKSGYAKPTKTDMPV